MDALSRIEQRVRTLTLLVVISLGLNVVLFCLSCFTASRVD